MNKNYIVQIFNNINTMNMCNMIFAYTEKNQNYHYVFISF